MKLPARILVPIVLFVLTDLLLLVVVILGLVDGDAGASRLLVAWVALTVVGGGLLVAVLFATRRDIREGTDRRRMILAVVFGFVMAGFAGWQLAEGDTQRTNDWGVPLWALLTFVVVAGLGFAGLGLYRLYRDR
jgi:multisubunit Na+/H+ antiporter MnhB subunit